MSPSPRASSRSRTPAASSAASAPTRASPSRRCAGSSGSSWRSCAQDPAIESVAGFTGGFSTNSGFVFATLKPLERAQDLGRPGDRPPAPQARPGAGRQPVPVGGAGHPGRRPPGQCAVPVHPAGRFAARPLHLGAQAGGGACARTSRSSPTSIPTSSSAACRSTSPSTATRRRGSACRRARSPRRCTTPSASARSRPSTMR